MVCAMAKLRVGIIGVGRHGSRYAHHAAGDVDGLELVAICRRNADKGAALADQLGCEYIANPHELIERSDIDAVVLVTLPSLLEELVGAATASGKRLLIEKPVAVNADVGGRILDLIENSNSYCLVGHTLRFNSVIAAITEHIDSIGRIDTLLFSQRFPPQLQLAWLDDPALAGGGNILHTGVHCFDLLRLLTNMEPTALSCVARRIYTRATEDSFTAQLVMPGSALALVTCSRTTRSRNGLIEISGENGQLVGDHVLNTLYRIDTDGVDEIAVQPPRHTVRAILERLVGDWRDQTQPPITYRDGLAAVAIADACYRAAGSGRLEPVVMPDQRP